VGNASACTVLIIGSDAQFIYLMRYYTGTIGHQAVVASINGDVVTLAAQKGPAVIVLDPDLMEPVSHDILQALKTDRSTCDIPVLVCSWRDKETSALAQEADSYLQKPVSYEGFLGALKEVACTSV
jgi:chemotaxis family two-component system response regulator PixH